MCTKGLSYLLLLVLCICQTGWAQDYQFESISVTDGLSQSSVYTMAQDKQGFLWIGTQDGLNRYDGHGFHVFKKDPFDSTSISDNNISKLLVDHKNRIWVGTMRGGLNYFDPKTETFIRFKGRGNKYSNFAGHQIFDLYQDSDYRLWVSSELGLREIIIPDGQHSLYNVRFIEPAWIKNVDIEGGVKDIVKDSDQIFWLATHKGIYGVHTKADPDGEINSMKLDCKGMDVKWRLDYPPYALCEIGAGKTAAIVGGKLFKLDGNKQELSPFPLTLSDQIEQPDIFNLLKLENDDLLICTAKRLYRLSFENGEYAQSAEPLLMGFNSDVNFQGEQVICLIADQLHHGLYWMGTRVHGMLKVYERKKKFNTQHLDVLRTAFGMQPTVFHILEDSLKHLWIGTMEGFVTYNPVDQKIIHFDNIDFGKKGDDFWIRRIFKDDKNNIWGLTAGGLVHFIIQKNKLFAKQVTDNPECPDLDVFSICQIGDQFLLGGINGLFVFDIPSQKLLSCKIEIENILEDRPHFRINAIQKDKQQNLWLGTSHGLILCRNFPQIFEADTDLKPEFYYYDEHNKNSLIENLVNDILVDQDGRVWIATMNGLSLAHIDKSGVWFESFSEQNGLSNNVIYGMLEEEAGNVLWLSTNNGLCRFDYNRNRIDNFNVHDGLQSNEFNGGAFYKNDDGYMYFGGIAGITHFYPQEIEIEQHRPPVWISRLHLPEADQFGNHISYNLLSDVEKKPICLNYHQNTFSVEFVGLDYLYPNELQFFYDLEGGTAKDIPIGNNQKIYFNELSPGDYTLCVKALNKDGIGNPLGDSIQFSILAPFWQTSWFFLLAGLTVILIGWWIYHFLYRMKMHRLAEIESVRKLAAQDFHDELGSKLSIISMYSELTRKQLEGKDTVAPGYLNKVITTSNSLYDSMKDLLWSLNPEQDTINDLFLNLKDFGEELYSHSDIEFQSAGIESNFADQLLPMQYKRHILLIFKEAMNNSLRHSCADTVLLRMANVNNVLTIIVADDGCGFDEEKALKGEGLNNMRSRARKINGKLIIQSTAEGSIIKLACPLL